MADQNPARAVRVDRDDDVALLLDSVAAGDVVRVDDAAVVAREDVAKGHKIAVRGIAAGAPVRRYRAAFGIATADIAPGAHVHVHNVRTALSGEDAYRYAPALPPAAAARAEPGFAGYVRADGSVATRNEIWVLPTVGCVGRLGERIAAQAGPRHAGRVDGVHAFNHPFGCSQLGDDLNRTAAILAALACNPNAGGVVLLGLGCESNQLDAMLARLPPQMLPRVRTVRAQASADEFAAGVAAVDALAEAAQATRQPVPLSALRLGVKCGGSDSMSGLTANPLIGRMTDRVAAAGGSVLMTEIPEIFGAERLLMARCADEAVFDRLVEVTNRFKRYFLDHGEPVSENPSPGNIAGGITTLEEKSLGAVQKGGLATVTDVLDYGEPVRKRGLSVVDGPGNDAVSTTALAAAGATLTLFSTGRGTPLGSPVPTMKIATNRDLATRKGGWIDFDASVALDDGQEAAADRLLAKIVAVASGEPARNEVNEERAIGIWKSGVTL
ncbi:altronate hydrolase [Sphingomonas sp. Leaf23]|uniref:UxaA family hydrolase n=1 Tax=Sphingomonas sp. Leaf23 TaxID=1735689 RepID=UPI0006FB381A|nr:altronate dehydratase family protein [Sphingomonas sp. Leaf23]KQM85600.1 altronate hydrolase [Sphingomonas sp. Leaf23]